MTLDDLEEIEKAELKQRDPREDRKLIPIDSVSQLDTGYTGRPDTDMQTQNHHNRK
jgi:hypothetical protein